MKNRISMMVERVAAKVLVGMTSVEEEDWDDSLDHMEDRLGEFVLDLDTGEMTGINGVGKAVQLLEREERNVGDPVARRAVDALLTEVARMLNGAEVEKRRMEDERAKHLSKCHVIQQGVRELMGKFADLKGGKS